MRVKEIQPEAKAIVLQMQNYSIHDGDGVRTTIFLSGCKLRCRWCANPESWTTKAKLVYHQHRCDDCNACVQACDKGLNPKERDQLINCDACGVCVSACPSNALEIAGKMLSVTDVVNKVKKDQLFFRHTGGGVTFSGGEPFLQSEFLNQIVPKLEELGIGMWAETCGLFHMKSVINILDKFDHLFIDIKHMDSEKHKEVTGQGNERILANIEQIYSMGVPITIRIPLIPSVNDDAGNLKNTAVYMAENLPGVKVEILPYHELGKSKFKALGMKEYWYSYRVPSQEEVEDAYKYFVQEGIQIAC